MGAVQYLPISEVSKVQSFVQFASPQGTATLLATALNTAFGAAAGFVQVTLDATTGQTTNALVVASDVVVFSVPVNNWVTFFNGTWSQLTPTQLASSYTAYFTS
jgi:hypothetical protein